MIYLFKFMIFVKDNISKSDSIKMIFLFWRVFRFLLINSIKSVNGKEHKEQFLYICGLFTIRFR